MEPRIQYAKTEDGVSIAYASEGEGPPLVLLLAPSVSHVQRAWGMFPDTLPSLTRTFRLILYDPRGAGLSESRLTSPTPCLTMSVLPDP